jgi:hypothetical protein
LVDPSGPNLEYSNCLDLVRKVIRLGCCSRTLAQGFTVEISSNIKATLEKCEVRMTDSRKCKKNIHQIDYSLRAGI